MRQSMTMLQRAVIRRLRKAGYDGLADAAEDAWPNNERVNLPNHVSERDADLRADFEQANRHATNRDR